MFKLNSLKMAFSFFSVQRACLTFIPDDYIRAAQGKCILNDGVLLPLSFMEMKMAVIVGGLCSESYLRHLKQHVLFVCVCVSLVLVEVLERCLKCTWWGSGKIQNSIPCRLETKASQ